MKEFFLRARYKISSVYYGLRCKDISKRDETRDVFAGEEVRRVAWAGGACAACNVQFDDFCAKSEKNGPYDFGGAPGEGINKIFDEFLRNHPEARATLFAIPKPAFENFEGIFYGDTKDRFDLSNPECSALVAWMKSRRSQVEIACHGYEHIQRHTKFFLAPAEFEFASEQESVRAILRARNIFQNIGIAPQGFRPPMWGIGENNHFAFLGALKKEAFKYVALSSPFSGLNFSTKRVSNVYPDYYQEMLNIPQNISLGWDMERILSAVDRIVAMNGAITLAGHYNAEDHWMEDGIGPRTMEKLDIIFAYLQKNHPNRIWHATLAEIADFWHTLGHEHRH